MSSHNKPKREWDKRSLSELNFLRKSKNKENMTNSDKLFLFFSVFQTTDISTYLFLFVIIIFKNIVLYPIKMCERLLKLFLSVQFFVFLFQKKA